MDRAVGRNKNRSSIHKTDRASLLLTSLISEIETVYKDNGITIFFLFFCVEF